ncbi:cysteine proteinase inhibitor 1-like [Vigna umbellata]|uniref:cysteine proteinase inhibitor 1-like n=1 Tax=Vigna umbellata TaxID=87088 RepID=UPI001F5ED511|nr:cysteine proteinase inhibitor 1-like [Vigna umbellata]
MIITMKHHCLLLLSLILVSYATRSEGALGGWEPIKDVKEQHVVEIAVYAVSEYDKRSGAKLKLVSVLKGETQVVAGTNYRLVLKTKGGSAATNYEAVVWEKPWLNFKNLTSFKPLPA